ncbi:MAG: Hsp33 family molecular chaperone HslO [Clostridia bacterium]|nr:Hsp33 family molecular chaperone HslO [Clostridia bacterium]
MQEKKQAKILRAMSQDGSARIFVINSTEIVNQAIAYHRMTPTAAATLGRTLTAASLMGVQLKEKDNVLTLSFRGNGPAGAVLATADYFGNVKGYIQNPDVDIPKKSNGKLNVSGAIGQGYMTVTKDLGMREPYVSQAPIVSGEIAEDVTSYYATSEQTPTLCALGVLIDVDYTCKGAGGVLIQLLPFADETTIDLIERNAQFLSSVSKYFADGKSNEEILAIAFQDIPFDLFDEIDVDYVCDCSRERTARALLTVGYDEVEDILAEQGQVEISCHFCDKKYVFTKEDCRRMFAEAKKASNENETTGS